MSFRDWFKNTFLSIYVVKVPTGHRTVGYVPILYSYRYKSALLFAQSLALEGQEEALWVIEKKILGQRDDKTDKIVAAFSVDYKEGCKTYPKHILYKINLGVARSREKEPP